MNADEHLTDAAHVRVLAIAGSLRRDSFNRRLLNAVAQLAPRGISIDVTTPSMRCRSSTRTSRARAHRPVSNNCVPPCASANGLMIATPEYNQALPGVVKNFVDWLSRGDASVLEGKPTAILGATPGSWGTRLAQASLRHILAACGALVMPAPQIYLRHATQLFDEQQQLIDPRAGESFADFTDLSNDGSDSRASRSEEDRMKIDFEFQLRWRAHPRQPVSCPRGKPHCGAGAHRSADERQGTGERCACACVVRARFRRARLRSSLLRRKRRAAATVRESARKDRRHSRRAGGGEGRTADARSVARRRWCLCRRRLHGCGGCRGTAFLAFAGHRRASTRQQLRIHGRFAWAGIERGRAAERKWRETEIAETIPAVAPDGGDVGMPLREAYEFYGTPRGVVPVQLMASPCSHWPTRSLSNAVGTARDITVPTLVVHSENALAPPLARQFIAGLRAPHRDLWLRSVGQIDFYDDPQLIGRAADAVAEFFRETFHEESHVTEARTSGGGIRLRAAN